MKAYARYYAGGSLSTSSFDFFVNDRKNELWFFCFWSESFGLSSTLLQLLVQMQNSQLIEKTEGELDFTSLRDSFRKSVFEYNSDLSYRLCYFRLNVHSLNIEGLCDGFAPPVFQDRNSGHWDNWQHFECLTDSPSRGEAIKGESENQTSYHFRQQLNPGSRISFFPSHGFNWTELDELKSQLNFFNRSAAEADCLDEFNLLLKEINEKKQEESDSLLALLEISEKKIHLA